MGSQPLRLQKNLVAGLVCKPVDLVFHAGAIARTNAFDLSGEHGAAVKARADDVVGTLVGMGNPARHLLRMHVCSTHITKDGHLGRHTAGHTVSGLFEALAEVNRAAINSGGRTGFEAALWQLQFFQTRRQTHGWRIARTTSGIVAKSYVDFSVQEGASRQHHRRRTKLNARLGDRTHHPIALNHQVFYRLLEKPQIRLVLQHASNGGLVQNAVRLRTGCAHGWPFRAVQNTKLDTALVCCQGHCASQRVNLFHQVAFADTANRRVATHLAQGFNVVGE